MFRNLRLSEKQRHVKVKVIWDNTRASSRVTEILDPPYRVVRKIKGVELRQAVKIFDLVDEIVM